jgi:glycosyltransferase involved in cell wall biosynthesis
MKVLLSHNFYQSSSPSGEDTVFRNEKELLKKNSVQVITYEKHNDEIVTAFDKFKAAFTTVWSGRTYWELKTLLKKERPDIAHFHNIWYLISPSAYYACKDLDVPVVQTLHNFRFFCVNGLLMRGGRLCEECIGRLPWKGVKYGCYRDSRLYSLPLAFTEGIHRIAGTWKNKVDAYIALTEFGKKKFIECGLPAEKIYVKPNFLPDPSEPLFVPVIPPHPPLAKGGRGDFNGYAVFLGRISAEKGLIVLISAFQYLSTMNYELSAISHQPFKLKVVGDGPLRTGLEDAAKAGKINGIEFTGRKDFRESMEILRHARFLIMPAICYEGFPMVIREAFACGKPVIASRLGAMAELIEEGKTGLLFEPGSPEDLADKMKWMIEHETDCIEMGKNARKVFEEKYTAEKNYEILIKIYEKIIAHGSSLIARSKNI